MIREYKGNPIRIHLDASGEPWWFAEDLVSPLGLKHIRQAVTNLDESEKDYVILNDVNRGTPRRSIVSESGLYKLIMRSHKSQAKVFQDWVTKEVLPSIRKTGSYSANPQNDLTEIVKGMATAIKLLTEYTVNNSKDIENIKKELSTKPLQLPEATPVVKLNYRTGIRMVIVEYGKHKGNKHDDYRTYWNSLYSQFYYRYGINLVLRAKRAGICTLDMAERLGVMDKLYALACDMYGNVRV